MNRYTVTFAEQAAAAVQAQVSYIAVEQQAPLNASRWLRRVHAAAHTLELMPNRFGVDEEQTAAHGTEVRRLVFERTYLLFYTVDEAQLRVTVVRFNHGARTNP